MSNREERRTIVQRLSASFIHLGFALILAGYHRVITKEKAPNLECSRQQLCHSD